MFTILKKDQHSYLRLISSLYFEYKYNQKTYEMLHDFVSTKSRKDHKMEYTEPVTAWNKSGGVDVCKIDLQNKSSQTF